MSDASESPPAIPPTIRSFYGLAAALFVLSWLFAGYNDLAFLLLRATAWTLVLHPALKYRLPLRRFLIGLVLVDAVLLLGPVIANLAPLLIDPNALTQSGAIDFIFDAIVLSAALEVGVMIPAILLTLFLSWSRIQRPTPAA